MKMSEILRQLSDMVAAAEQGQGDQHTEHRVSKL